jgi:phosphoesterase RecJ-like protein
MDELFSQQEIDRLMELTRNADNEIVTVTHINPDGDAIGSTVAWHKFLRSRGIRSTMIVPNRYPDFLKWIKGSEKALIYTQHVEEAERILRKAKLLFCLDFNNLQRLDNLGEFIAGLTIDKVLIDHHIGANENDFTLCLSKIPMSSTSEIIYDIIRQISGKRHVATDIAEALYCGIMTDTGAFSHSTTPALFRLVANLMESQIDKVKIHSLVYNNFSADRMRLMGYCVCNKMEVLPEYNTAYIYLTQDELEQFNFEPGDTEGFVNIPLSIRGIMMSALFVENDRREFIKISFRSVGEFSVDNLARKYFNGGGHKNASGGKSYLSLADTVQRFKDVLPEFRDELRHPSFFDNGK